MAGIIGASLPETAEDPFGGPQGLLRTTRMVAAAVQWADKILRKMHSVFGTLKAALILASF
jgi:hypothetical protein